MSLQRYDLSVNYDEGGIPHSIEIVPFEDGDYFLAADIEPLLPRWVPTSERLPEQIGSYTIVIAGVMEEDLWLGDGWDCFQCVSHWLEINLPPLPPESP